MTTSKMNLILFTNHLNIMATIEINADDFVHSNQTFPLAFVRYTCGKVENGTAEEPIKLALTIHRYYERYVVVVQLDCCGVQLEDAIHKKLQGLVDVLAKNALVWYSEYIKKFPYIQKGRKYKAGDVIRSSWVDFFLSRPIRFIKNLNEECERCNTFDTDTRKWLNIGDYLRLTGLFNNVHIRLSMEEYTILDGDA